MILYNVTLSVEASIADEWLTWMKDTHINDVMGTGLFTSFEIYKVLLQKEDELTYSVQYFVESMSKLQQYQAKHAQQLQAKHINRYGDKIVAFRTVLESV